MKKILNPHTLICIFYFASANGFTQTVKFQRMYGDTAQDIGGMVIQSYDSGFVVLGKANYVVPNQSEAFLFKTDSMGDTLWTKKYSGNPGTTTQGDYFIATPDSGFALFVRAEVSSPSLITNLIIKVDKNGDTLWVKGGIAAYPVYLTTDGGGVFVGSGCICKTDAAFNVQWWYHYGGPLDYGQSQGKQTTDGGYILFSRTRSYSLSGNTNDNDWYIVKTDSLGIIQWTKIFAINNDFDQYVGDIIQTVDGGYLAVGSISCPTVYDIAAIKMDALGNIQWQKQYGGPLTDYGWEVRGGTGGVGYVITGVTLGMDGFLHSAFRSYILGINASGNFTWGRMYGSIPSDPSEDNAYHLENLYDGDYLFSGYAGSWGAGSNDIWLIKIDGSNGYSGCNDTVVSVITATPTVGIGFANVSTPLSFPPLQEVPINVSSWNSMQLTILCTTDSTWLGVNETETENDFLIYPNPSNGIVKAKMKEKGEAAIYNMLGEKIGSWQLAAGENEINLSTHPGGIYFVRMQTEKGIWGKKIVLQK